MSLNTQNNITVKKRDTDLATIGSEITIPVLKRQQTLRAISALHCVALTGAEDIAATTCNDRRVGIGESVSRQSGPVW
jgi:hypothetical protein